MYNFFSSYVEIENRPKITCAITKRSCVCMNDIHEKISLCFTLNERVPLANKSIDPLIFVLICHIISFFFILDFDIENYFFFFYKAKSYDFQLSQDFHEFFHIFTENLTFFSAFYCITNTDYVIYLYI